jgi:hypothetical protein
MARMYTGRIPSASDGWEKEESFFLKNGELWHLYKKSQPESQDWVTIKVISIKEVFAKANYWFSVNLRDGQIGFGRDYMIMRTTRPELFSQVDSFTKKIIDQLT